MDERLKGHVCENRNGKHVEMYACFLGRVVQESKVQAWRSKLWRGHDGGAQAGIRCLGKENRVGERAPIAGKALLLPLSADRRRSGGRKRKGMAGGVAMARFGSWWQMLEGVGWKVQWM